MKTMKWLVRREVWENKGMLTWVPLVLSALLIGFVLIALVKGSSGSFYFDGMRVTADGLAVELGDRQKLLLTEATATAYPLGAVPLYLSLAFMVFFYSLGALYDERRDRSILFWKSLPVSDSAAVLSKVTVALIGIPLLIILVELATSLVILAIMLIVLASKGVNLVGDVLTHAQFWLGPLKLLSLLPVYALWALPTVGWLLLVSAWARSKAFLWAVGTPVVAIVLVAWAEKGLRMEIESEWLITKVIGRLLVSVMPGTWLLAGHVTERALHSNPHPGPAAASDLMYTTSWAAMATPDAIIGALAGAAMIGAAIWLRHRREEN
jgi:ABC-2 type transport system permease protein